MTEELSKLAHSTILQLKEENEELESKVISLSNELDKVKEAVKLAFDLYSLGQLASEQLQEKIAEYTIKTNEDLNTIRKASEFIKSASSYNSFKLSSKRSHYETPESRFISSILEEN